MDFRLKDFLMFTTAKDDVEIVTYAGDKLSVKTAVYHDIARYLNCHVKTVEAKESRLIITLFQF